MVRNKSTPITEAGAIPHKRIHKQRHAYLLPAHSLTQIPKSLSRPQSSSLEISRDPLLVVKGSQSSTSTIDIWLNDQPDQPEDYQFKGSPTSKRKRRRTQRVPNQTLPKHSHMPQQLMEVSGNNTKSVEQSPSRNLRSSHQRAPLSLQYNAQTSISSESRDSKDRRSVSPTKHLGDLQLSNMPVDSRAWSTATIPTELKDFVDDMARIADGIEIIPTAVKDNFVAIGETVRDHSLIKEDKKYGVKKAEKGTMGKMTGGLNHTKFWDRVLMIRRSTLECVAENVSEPSWNSEVHSTLLRLALEGYWETQEVWYRDITTARISSKSLVPWNMVTGAMQSKMVDYAIMINPSREFTDPSSGNLHNHVVEKLKVEKAVSINQTAAEYVRYKPIAVNIETKRGAVGEDEAHIQLSTWLTAQYTRLRQLMPPNAKTELPSFPVLSVQGQRWLLMIAWIHDNGRIDLIKELHLGLTGSAIGVYQVIAAIQRIAQWVKDVYRPWFEREILGIRAGGPGKKVS